MKILSTCIISVAAFAGSVLMPKVASAYSYIGVDHTYSFDGLVSGSCDSAYSSCTIPDWTTWIAAGRAGYSNTSGNTWLTLSNDDNWNSWNTWFNPTFEDGGIQTQGQCMFTASIFAPGTSRVGEVDLDYYDSHGVLALLGSADIFGTNNTWETEFSGNISISPALALHRGGILLAYGRHSGEYGGEFIAMDNVRIYCTHN